MRVAIDVGPLRGPRTGVGAAVAGLVESLRQRPDVELLPYVLSTRAVVAPPERRLPLPAAVAQRLWARADRPRLDRWLDGAQVVHGTNYVVPPSRHPQVVSVYDCWFLERPELATPTVRRAGAVLRRRVAAGAHVVTSSAATADRVRDLLGTDRVDAVHLGPPTPADPPERAPRRLESLADRDCVLSIGTLEVRKNVPALVAAFGLLAAEVDTATLVIAGGDGDDVAAVDAAVNALPPRTTDRVVRLGRVDEREKAWLLHHAGVLAYPSLDEGFGFPLLEAQQADIPVVASDVGSIREVGGPGLFLHPPHDVDALAALLHVALTDRPRRDAAVDQGRINLGRFSWADTADATTALYGRVAEADATR